MRVKSKSDVEPVFSRNNTLDLMLLAKFSIEEYEAARRDEELQIDLDRLCQFANVVGATTVRYLEELTKNWLLSEYNAAVTTGNMARAETIDSLIAQQF